VVSGGPTDQKCELKLRENPVIRYSLLTDSDQSRPLSERSEAPVSFCLL